MAEPCCSCPTPLSTIKSEYLKTQISSPPPEIECAVESAGYRHRSRQVAAPRAGGVAAGRSCFPAASSARVLINAGIGLTSACEANRTRRDGGNVVNDPKGSSRALIFIQAHLIFLTSIVAFLQQPQPIRPNARAFYKVLPNRFCSTQGKSELLRAGE